MIRADFSLGCLTIIAVCAALLLYRFYISYISVFTKLLLSEQLRLSVLRQLFPALPRSKPRTWFGFSFLYRIVCSEGLHIVFIGLCDSAVGFSVCSPRRSLTGGASFRALALKLCPCAIGFRLLLTFSARRGSGRIHASSVLLSQGLLN